jgi:hypothetical protein
MQIDVYLMKHCFKRETKEVFINLFHIQRILTSLGNTCSHFSNSETFASESDGSQYFF